MLGGKIHSVDTYRVYFLYIYLSSVKFISLLGKICDDTGKTGYVPMKEENLFKKSSAEHFIVNCL